MLSKVIIKWLKVCSLYCSLITTVSQESIWCYFNMIFSVDSAPYRKGSLIHCLGFREDCLIHLVYRSPFANDPLIRSSCQPLLNWNKNITQIYNEGNISNPIVFVVDFPAVFTEGECGVSLHLFSRYYFLFRWQFICYFYGNLGILVLIAAVALHSCTWQHRCIRDHLSHFPASPQLEKMDFMVITIQLQLRGHLRICKLFSLSVGATLENMDKGFLCPLNYLNSIYPKTRLVGFFPSFL